MSNLNAKNDKISFNVLTKKEIAELEKKQITNLEKANSIMDKPTLEKKLKEFDIAIKKGDYSNFSDLETYFKNVLECLGSDHRKKIEIDKNESALAIKESGVTALKLVEYKNADAKLEIYDYKERIEEAIKMIKEKSNFKENAEVKEERKFKKRDGLLLGGVFGLVALIAGTSLGVQGCNNKNKDNSIKNTTSSITDTNSDESTTTLVVTTSTGDYTVETVDPNYSSPTRETTNADSNSNSNNSNNNGNSGVEPDATTSHIRNTTPNGHESVISAPTSPTTKPVSNETTTVQTDVNGTQPGHTEPEVKPTGNDSLPVEPTRVTVDRSIDPTPTPKPTEKPTEATTTTEGTTKADPTPTPKPATPTPKPATPTPKPVPVETVDPNDPDNVIEKTKAKKLALKLS